MGTDILKSELEIFDDLEDKPDANLDTNDEQIIDKFQLKQNQEEQLENPIKKIYKAYDYEQLKNFTSVDNPKFYIGTKAKLSGMISYFEEEYKKKMVLVSFVRLKSKDKDTESYKVYFFTDYIPEQERAFIYKTIEAEFYLYQFTSEDKKFILFSEEKLELEDYHIRGTIIEARDFADIGKYARIGFKKPLLFVNKALRNQVKFQNHEQFFKCFKPYKLTRKKLINWIFTNSQGWVYEYPESFTDVLLSNILATPNISNDMDCFHLPLLIIGLSGTGKTTACNLLYKKLEGNNKEFVNLTSSTLKGLIPSFRNPTDLKQGYLLECKRLALVDEFFQGLKNMADESVEKDRAIECIKNLLDYELRAFKSGQGTMKGKMRAEHIALTNPKYYGDNVLSLSKKFFPENLARFFIWYIPQEQVKFIDEKKENTLSKAESLGLSKEEFLAGLDYLKTFNCEYDTSKVKEVYNLGLGFLNSQEGFRDILNFYRSRYFTHACRLLDSLIKFRVWSEGGEFKAKQEDYKKLKELWLEMLENWGIGFLLIKKEKI